jgi:hypothetical protein
MKFQFEAMDPTGRTISDVIEASSREVAESYIRNMGYYITSIRQAKESVIPEPEKTIKPRLTFIGPIVLMGIIAVILSIATIMMLIFSSSPTVKESTVTFGNPAPKESAIWSLKDQKAIKIYLKDLETWLDNNKNKTVLAVTDAQMPKYEGPTNMPDREIIIFYSE